MAYSSDEGASWTGIPPGTDNGTSSTFGTTVINGIAYGNGTWVAVGMEGKIAYSSDGIHWTGVSPSPNPGLTLNGVAYGDGKWIACGTLVSGSNSNKLVSSVDNGISWTANSGANSIFYSGISNGYSILGIAYGGGNWVVVGNGPSSGGKRGFSSDGGASWTEISSPFGTSNIRDVAYGGAAGSEQFFAVGDASKIDFSN
jgi:hypothetical protein